jgi:hypothetical protein
MYLINLEHFKNLDLTNDHLKIKNLDNFFDSKATI